MDEIQEVRFEKVLDRLLNQWQIEVGYLSDDDMNYLESIPEVVYA